MPVSNAGPYDGDEVVQVYARRLDPASLNPIHSLVAFHRLAIHPGGTGVCDFSIPAERLRHWDVVKKAYVVDPGKYELQIAAASDDIRQVVQVSVK